MYQDTVLGVDIGGSHVTAAMISLERGTILHDSKVRLDLDSNAGKHEIIAVWKSAIELASSKASDMENHLIGISMPGPLDYEKGISYIKHQDKYDALYGLNLKDILSTELRVPSANIRFENDATSFLRGEILGGAAKMCRNVLGVTLGTGLGSAKSINNGAVCDADLWNMPFKDSVAEEYLSTRWFKTEYFQLTGRSIPNVKALAQRVKNGDSDASMLFKEFGRNLGLFLKGFVNLESDIDTVVLGGNIVKSSGLFMTRLLEAFDMDHIAVKQAELGEDAALIGAAGLWKVSGSKLPI